VKSRSQAVWCAVLLAGQLTSMFLLLRRADADVYYYKDSVGVLHFTNARRPGALPFLIEPPLARMRIESEVARGIPDSAAYDEIIGEAAKRFRVEPALVKAVIRAESGFNRMATSSAGARGLMQLMPDTAKHHGVRNIWDAQENIEGGCKHLRLLIKRHGNSPERVLAAYNAGSDQVDRYNGKVPPITETQIYVARVMRFRDEYKKREKLAQVARQF
jgi:soluble lytic murein transglycosylase-like protein